MIDTLLEIKIRRAPSRSIKFVTIQPTLERVLVFYMKLFQFFHTFHPPYNGTTYNVQCTMEKPMSSKITDNIVTKKTNSVCGKVQANFPCVRIGKDKKG